MLKVMLINPPDGQMIQGAIPAELGSDRMGKYPPLGLLYIATAAMAQNHDLEIKIVDAITDSLSHADVKRELAAFQPDVIGMTVYTFTVIDALDVARAAKEMNPGIKVIFGGFHPSIYPRESLLCGPYVDIAINGEAEDSFTVLTRRLADGQPLDGIPGVSFKKDNGDLHISSETPFVADLDALPFPNRRLVNYRKHSCILGAQGLSTNILSSRGCPFRCQYCFVNIRKYRLRSLTNLMAEIRECMDLGISEFFFMDDLFNANKKRVIDFSDQVLRENLGIQWNFRGRVDHIDELVLEKARAAGCTRIHFGVESGVPEILRRIQKETNLDQIRKAITLTHKAGIEVSSNIMIGLPGESPEKTEQTTRFLLSLDTDYVQAAVFTPYPETPLYRDGLESGMIPKNDYWREFALHPQAGFKPHIWGEFYTQEQVFDKLRELYRRFYLRPRFLGHYLKRLNSWSSFCAMCQNAMTFISLLLKLKSRS